MADIPEPNDDDPEDVRWALSTAERLVATGAREAAARWLRRAASAARDHDRGDRAEEIDTAARNWDTPAAAGIDDEATVVSTTPEVALAPEGRRSRSTKPSTASRTPASRLVVDSVLPPSTEREPRIVTRRAGVRDTAEDTRIPAVVRATARDDASTLPPTSSSPPAGTVGESSDTMMSYSRYRVAVLASSDDAHPRLLRLRDGEAAPPGAAMAFLVPESAEDGAAIAALFELG
ncbi:MAG: hypothetical protein AAF715_10760 [Myxococcota bacterium]